MALSTQSCQEGFLGSQLCGLERGRNAWAVTSSSMLFGRWAGGQPSQVPCRSTVRTTDAQGHLRLATIGVWTRVLSELSTWDPVGWSRGCSPSGPMHHRAGQGTCVCTSRSGQACVCMDGADLSCTRVNTHVACVQCWEAACAILQAGLAPRPSPGPLDAGKGALTRGRAGNPGEGCSGPPTWSMPAGPSKGLAYCSILGGGPGLHPGGQGGTLVCKPVPRCHSTARSPTRQRMGGSDTGSRLPPPGDGVRPPRGELPPRPDPAPCARFPRKAVAVRTRRPPPGWVTVGGVTSSCSSLASPGTQKRLDPPVRSWGGWGLSLQQRLEFTWMG